MEKYLINTTIGGVQIPVYKDNWGVTVEDNNRVSYTTLDSIPERLKALLDLDSGLNSVIAASDTSVASLISENLVVKSGGPWYLTIRVDSSGTVYVPEEARICMAFTKTPDVWNSTKQIAGFSAIYYTKNGIGTRTYILIGNDGRYYTFVAPYPIDRISKTNPARFQGGGYSTSTYPVTLNSMMNDIVLSTPTSGGGAGGPTSGPGGGGGNFDNTSDTISTPSGNIKGLVDSGMMGIFSPSEAQLKEFSTFLWSNNIFDQIKKYNDPLDMIISLTQIPTSPPISGNGLVKIGNVLLSETFTLPYVSNQFFEFDMGEISIPEYWGNFLDYSPYTNIQIYLPYIGFREISTDDVMGGTIKLKYVIDCISGTCLGILEVVKKDFDSVLYQWTGNCSMEIPLTGRRTKVDFSSLFSILGTAAGGAAIGGAAGAAVSSGLGAVNAISQSSTKPIISRSGNISSNGGFAGVQTPYIVISRKIQSLPDKYQVFDGYPSNISSKLSDLKGFVKVSKIHLDGIPCTESELDEINEYLTGGIII